MKRATKIVLVVALLVALTAGVAVAATIVNCNTQSAGTCTGTTGDDKITGTNNPETIKALAGNDVVEARGDDDTVNGGAGNDQLTGEGGCDTIKGGKGKDKLDVATNDTCTGNVSNPTKHDTVNASSNEKDKIIAGDAKRDEISCDSLDKLVSFDPNVDKVNGVLATPTTTC